MAATYKNIKNIRCKLKKIANSFKSMFTLIFKIMFKMYKLILSPVLHFMSLSTVVGGCRFYPTCSEYSKQVIELYGFGFNSFKLILFRILRCQPINFNNNSGYDPVIKHKCDSNKSSKK